MSKSSKHADPDYKGEKCDEKLRNGPIADRSCTDIICCLLFFVFLLAMFAVAGVAYNQGDPEKLATPFDPDGKACGNSSDIVYKDYPYIYFAQLTPYANLARTVCVKECPPDNTTTYLQCIPNSKVKSCKQNQMATYDETAIAQVALGRYEVVSIYKTTPVLGALCIPSDTAFFDKMKNATAVNNLARYLKDVVTLWWMIAVVVAIAMIFGVIVMVLLKYCIKPIVWGVILFFIVAMAALGYLFFYKYRGYEDNDQVESGNQNVDEDTKDTNKKAFLVLFIVFWSIGAVALLLTCCFFNKIRLVIAILRAAADFVKETLSALWVPPVIGLFQIMLYVSWLYTVVYLYSTGELERPDDGYPLGSIKVDNKLAGYLAFHLFGLLWINAFLMANGQFILASAVAIWYFMRKQAHGPVSTGVRRAILYHMGSLAFGSLLLAIVQFIRIVFQFIKNKLKNQNGAQNAALKCIFRIMDCLLACFERFIKFINSQAYIQIALTGKNFCRAAVDAFYLLFRNTAVFGLTHGLALMFVFVGKCFITAVPTVLGFIIITQVNDLKKQISSPIPLSICFGVVSYSIGGLFMQVWGMAAETILQAYLVDIEVNQDQPANCPETLKEFVEQTRKQQPKDTRN